MSVFRFEDLSDAPLVVDALYKGGRSGNASDAPLPKLLSVSNSGGFRYRGNIEHLELLVLVSSFVDLNWPDNLDPETGILTYYGDNKEPGIGLHDTPRRGNQVLQRIFEDAAGGKDGRFRVPPIFVFSTTGEYRDVIFRGLAVPGTSDQQIADDLIAIWRTKNGMRFQNYRAQFTILNEAVIVRDWLNKAIQGDMSASEAPRSWTAWRKSGVRKPLLSVSTIEYRSRSEQIPVTETGREIIKSIHKFFQAQPHSFEACAAALARVMIPQIVTLDLTRPSRDGGRDAIGTMRIGDGISAVLVDFALEAKCYGESVSVGVRDVSRLISRLRHRQFGILVTTSWVDLQAYKEIKEDRHPIVIISGREIVALLNRIGLPDPTSVRKWLEAEFNSQE